MNSNYLKQNWQLPVILLLAALQGYHFGIGDLSTYVPFVWHHFDNTILANDLLIETLGDHPVYVWKVLALFLHIIDIQTLFLVLFIAQITVLIFAYRYFYQTFFPGNAGWLLLLLTLVVPALSPAMGRYGLNPYEYFHPGALAFGCLLIGYSLIDRGSWKYGAALLGFIFLFHPFTALYGGMILAFRMVLDFKKVPLQTLIISGALFLCVSSPAWVPHLMHIFSEQSVAFDKELWLQLVNFRMSDSFFISRWYPDPFIHLGLSAVGILAFYKSPVFRRLLPLLLTVITALLIMAAADIFSIKFFLQLQLARNSFLLYVVITALVINRLWTLQPEKLRGAHGLLLLVPLAFMLQRMVGDRHNAIRWFLVAAAVLGCLYLIWQNKEQWQKNYLLLAWMLVFTMTGYAVLERYWESERIFDLTGASEWEQVQLWCSENIPLDEVLMTPTYRTGFRSLSKRAIYGSYKDGAPHNYSKKTIFRWWDRMQELGSTLPFKRNLLAKQYRENSVSAARKAGIRYLVFEKHKTDIRFKDVLYQNKQFSVIDLNQISW